MPNESLHGADNFQSKMRESFTNTAFGQAVRYTLLRAFLEIEHGLHPMAGISMDSQNCWPVSHYPRNMDSRAARLDQQQIARDLRAFKLRTGHLCPIPLQCSCCAYGFPEWDKIFTDAWRVATGDPTAQPVVKWDRCTHETPCNRSFALMCGDRISCNTFRQRYPQFANIAKGRDTYACESQPCYQTFRLKCSAENPCKRIQARLTFDHVRPGLRAMRTYGLAPIDMDSDVNIALEDEIYERATHQLIADSEPALVRRVTIPQIQQTEHIWGEPRLLLPVVVLAAMYLGAAIAAGRFGAIITAIMLWLPLSVLFVHHVLRTIAWRRFVAG